MHICFGLPRHAEQGLALSRASGFHGFVAKALRLLRESMLKRN
jgi:hypothetical protein